MPTYIYIYVYIVRWWRFIRFNSELGNDLNQPGEDLLFNTSPARGLQIPRRSFAGRVHCFKLLRRFRQSWGSAHPGWAFAAEICHPWPSILKLTSKMEWSLLRTKTKIIRVWQISVYLQLKSIQTSATECIRMPDIGLSSCCKDMDCMGFRSPSSVELPQFWGGGKKFAGWSTSFDRLRWLIIGLGGWGKPSPNGKYSAVMAKSILMFLLYAACYLFFESDTSYPHLQGDFGFEHV